MPSALPLAVTMGDPAGCGPLITRATWQALRGTEQCFYVLGAPELYAASGPCERISAPEEAARVFPNALPVLPLATPLPAIEPGQPDPSTGPAILESIETAAAHTLAGKAAAIVTNPISKALLYQGGFRHPGHTEYIAALCSQATGADLKPIMMLVGGGLRVALATIHIPLAKAPETLSTPGLVQIGTIVSKALRQDFGIENPRVAFTGLNPHAGEDGTIGREEVEIINPAAEQLRAKGFNVANARPGDTVFHEALSGAYDAVIAMTHDQGLIPVKTLDMWGGVNTTLGLPIIRTSPDHGTAYDAAAAGSARPDSLIASITLASEMAAARARAYA